MMKNNKNFYILFLIMFVSALLFLFVLATFPDNDIKYAENYRVSDIIKARNIILDDSVPTKEELDKYDINDDMEINNTDIELMRHMILGLYDCYEVRDERKKAIKYTNE